MFRRFQDFLELVAVGAIMVLAAAVHSPYAEGFAAALGPYSPLALWLQQ
jgi:hypothetical protein